MEEKAKEEGSTVQLEVYHKEYNLDKKDNLSELPQDPAVFGIFAIIHEKPVNCRFVGEAENLQKGVVDQYEKPEGEGFKKFMQGPWKQMLVYELMPGSTPEQRKAKVAEWTKQHDPKCDDEGEYPKES